MPSIHGQRRFGVLSEGVVVGVIGAAVVAAWFLAYDLATGIPLRTPSLLGEILFSGGRPMESAVYPSLVVMYTLVHLAIFGAFGVLLAGLFNLADREPAVLFGAFMLLCCFQVAFIAMLKIAAEWALEPIPLWAILVGNFLATLAMLGVLFPQHPAAWRPWFGRRDPLEAPREQPIQNR